jgi:hypothetical protein
MEYIGQPRSFGSAGNPALHFRGNGMMQNPLAVRLMPHLILAALALFVSLGLWAWARTVLHKLPCRHLATTALVNKLASGKRN